MKMNQQIFRATHKACSDIIPRKSIFFAFPFVRNANSNPDLNWNNAEKEDDVQNNNKKMGKKRLQNGVKNFSFNSPTPAT